MAVQQAAVKRTNAGRHYRTRIAVRTLAAILAGYALASASTVLLSMVLPFDRAERVFTATLLSFAVWIFAALYAFAAKTAWRAVWVTIGLAIIMALPVLVVPGLSVRP
jgi:membrane-bound metal-dependent hydrolase YbcI (DUF457 family)